MPKNLLDLRFGIRRHDGFVSNIWRAWATAPGDVYLATRSMAGITKYSYWVNDNVLKSDTKATDVFEKPRKP